MRVAIMQPTWLPWMGYFDLIDQVDQFVFLDTVQFSKQSWHCRNRHALSYVTITRRQAGGRVVNSVLVSNEPIIFTWLTILVKLSLYILESSVINSCDCHSY